MLFVHPLVVLLNLGAALAVASAKRDLAQVRYRFTSCGASGRSGPSFSLCQGYYTQTNSPITNQDLLFEFENREYEGAQGFRVPVKGLYNITVAGAGGGRGICNFEHGGFGYLRTVQVELSTDYELLVLVGQRGTGPCDVIPESDDIYERVCRTPPTIPTEVLACNQTWHNFTVNVHHLFYEALGGGAGGGGTLVRARNRETKEIDRFPIVIVGGGGGTSSVLHYDVVEDIGVNHVFLANHFAYRTFVNGQSRTHNSNFGAVAGARGFRIDSTNTVAGAGGGFSVGFMQSINVDGGALGRAQDLAEGGFDCIQSFSDIGENVPYFGVYGGFGGGGGACGGGGAGGGYTGGAVLDVGVTVPGGGGFSFVGNSITTSFAVYTVDAGRLNNNRDEGFVEIVLANCGCVYECLVNTTEDQFECLCPNNTELAPNLNDCFANKDIGITEEPVAIFANGLYSKYIQLQNSTYILSNDITLESDNAMCVLFWLGEDSEVTLATNVVRGMGTITNLAVIEDGVMGDLVAVLNTSILVTGALLIGTGDCTIVGSSIGIGESIQTTTVASVSAEMFRAGNSSSVEQSALEIAVMLFMEPTVGTNVSVLGGGAIAGITIGVIATVVLLASVLLLGIYCTYITRRSSKDVLNEIEIPESAFHYKDSLIENLAYTRFVRGQLSDENPNSTPSPDEHRYEVLSYTSEQEDLLSPTEAQLTPIHGVTAPLHDFSTFNRQRRNTLVNDSTWHYPRNGLIYMRELGEGQFGKVLLMKAKDIAGYSGMIPVAVKTLTSRDPDVVRKFYEEAELMKKFSHPKVVSLLGFTKEEEGEDSAPLMVLEFMQYGDLAAFLKSHRPVDDQESVIGESKFYSFASDVAEGMEFLSSLKYVHRDLAARNCLVGTGLSIKIADFGLARGVHNKDYYKVGGAAVLPVKWMAPESLLFGVFTSASDVWSYGVLLWEIVTYGGIPLENISVENIIAAAQNKTLYHARPPKCPDNLFELMSECLEQDSDNRPRFTDIVAHLNKFKSNNDSNDLSDSDTSSVNV